ncbi:MAG: hypothetical protein ACOQNY_02135 [Mycoplasmoidaceae bacterium]
MKTKTKLLMPILATTAVTAATVAPLVSLTSCSATIWNVLNTWRDSNGRLYLGGMIKGVPEKTIRKVLGNTLTIPKEVEYITPYAFVDRETMKTTLPSFIKNFRFEDGYKCKEIPEYAFYGAPFEKVIIEGERYDGVNGEVSPFGRHDDGWGLQSLGFASFFQDKELKYVKLPSNIRSVGAGNIGATYGQYVFGYSTKPIEETTDSDITSDLEVIDLSDPNFYGGSSAEMLPNNANGDQMFGHAFSQYTTDTTKQWKKQFLMRIYNGTDAPNRIGDIGTSLDYLHRYQNFLYLQQAQEFNEEGFHIDGVNQDGNTWKFDAVYIPTKTYSKYKIDDRNVSGLSTTYPAEKFLDSGVSEWTNNIQRHKYEIDMANWKGSFGKNWKMYIVNGDIPVYFKENSVVITLDDQQLSPSTDYSFEADGSILLKKGLSKKSKVKIMFWANGQYSNSPRFIFTKA